MKGTTGKLVGKVTGKSVVAAGKGAGGLAAAVGGSAGGLAVVATSSLGITIAAIPVLQGIVAESQRPMARDLEETRGERKQLRKNYSSFLTL